MKNLSSRAAACRPEAGVPAVVDDGAPPELLSSDSKVGNRAFAQSRNRAMGGRATLCVLALFLFAAASDYLSKPRSVLLNGKPLLNAYNINGTWFVALEDLAKAAGSTTTLEPQFQLQGKKLFATGTAAIGDIKSAAAGQIKGESSVAGIKIESAPAIKGESVKVAGGAAPISDKASPVLASPGIKLGTISDKHAAAGIKLRGAQSLQVARGGQVSANVDYFNGKAYVPLSDVVKSLGAKTDIPIESIPAADPIKLNQDRRGCSSANCILIGL